MPNQDPNTYAFLTQQQKAALSRAGGSAPQPRRNNVSTVPQSRSTGAINPFSPEGATRLSQITGQQLATSPVDVSALSSSTQVNLPSLPSFQSRNIQDLVVGNTPRQDVLQSERDSLIGDITNANERIGQQATRRRELEAQQNLPALNQQLLELNNQMRQIQSDAFAATQRSEDRLAPTFAIQGEQAQIDRQRSVRVYGLAAASEAIQGNIALAQDYVQTALEEEFGPLQQEIENKKFLLEINRDNFSVEEQRRAEQLQIELNREEEKVLQRKEDRQAIMDVMLVAAQNGATNAIIERIRNAAMPMEAISIASQFLRDPAAQLELESIRLNNVLRREQIATEQKERSLLGQKTEQELKAESEAIKNAEASLPILQDKVDLIDALKTHEGLSGRVGPNPFGRLRFASDISGASQEFVGGVHKLVNGLTLDNLIAAKERGATFGALSDTELRVLASAATAVSDWEIKDANDKGTGVWNIDEKAFKDELETIRALTQRAITQAEGRMFTTGEDALLDEIFNQNTGAFQPGSFF